MEEIQTLARLENVGELKIQVILTSKDMRIPIRNLTSKHVSKLVNVPGVVVSTSSIYCKPVHLVLQCRNCKHEMTVDSSGFGSTTVPAFCNNPNPNPTSGTKCPANPYLILEEKSKYVDTQRVTLQESPETVPTGLIWKKFEKLSRKIICFINFGRRDAETSGMLV